MFRQTRILKTRAESKNGISSIRTLSDHISTNHFNLWCYSINLTRQNDNRLPTRRSSLVAVHCFDLRIWSMEAEVVAYWIFTGWFMVDTQLFKSLNPGRSLAMVLGSRSFTASSRLVQRSTTAWWFGKWILFSIQLGMSCHPNWRTHSIIFQRARNP